MRNLAFITALVLTVLSCRQKGSNKNSAIELNDSAISVAMNQGDFEKAIILLDQATKIDSTLTTAYENKLTFQIEVKDYSKALTTALKLTQLKPDIIDYRVTSGILYDLKGDSSESKKCFIEAIRQYDEKLTKMSSANGSHENLLLSKALNLIFLGQVQKGNDILKQLYSKSQSKIFKESVSSYLNKSKLEIYNLLLLPGEGVSEARPN